jgi:dissimilatory sulfite reductase related protein
LSGLDFQHEVIPLYVAPFEYEGRNDGNGRKEENVEMAYEINGENIEHDEEGYLSDINQWTPELAALLAKDEGIEMTDEHWEVINFLREYYEEYQIAPAIRVLVKALKKKFGPEKGSNKYLYELFPYGPAKQACKVGGLPKPTGCI